MLGQPLFMLTPQVVGVRSRRRSAGVTATDLTLTITQLLRKKGVVDKIVEFYGPALSHRRGRPRHHRQHGARVRRHHGLLPGRRGTLEFLRRTGRPSEVVAPWSATARSRASSAPTTRPSRRVHRHRRARPRHRRPCLAGPKRPQDRVALSAMKSSFRKALRPR
jgi:aconitate hydratase